MNTGRQTIMIEGYETVRTLLSDARLSSAPLDGQAGFGGRHIHGYLEFLASFRRSE